ncbi:MAG: SAM-dependent methyltransferase [Dokdonella sp.]|uniref:class I SAM-dependent methyltransferase n=1 Tax=Dokdonella sp. TaxID=2291710 RepID=UPI0025C710B6|nr:SAM-dependent methyltransferase [Dokdonella sp.]MBX3700754.1 SAM-dependent methyltransferase [Dokdonella sp.]
MQTRLPEPGADELAHSRQLAALIRNEIAASGPLPFSRYMMLALYAPGLGYYSAGRTKFGAAGDFVTAPELGSLYARCIAHAVAASLRELGADADFLELGGGSGAFAVAALGELQRRDALPRRYLLLEPSADLRARQHERIARELPAEIAARVHWLDRPPQETWQGVLFANEVIDALPSTRFAIHAGEVYEEHIDLAGDGLRRVDRPADALVAGAVRHVERELGTALPDGYRSEILPQLPYWLQAVAAPLARGLALFVDYGYPRREFYLPERSDGTLVCHYRHHAHADPLHWPGLTDITAFVDFTALAEAGVGAGFDLVGYAPQGQFLLGSGLLDLVAEAGDDPLEHLRRVAEVKRLTLPGEMGERFQAMAFARGLADPLPSLRAFDRSRRL